jgi:hypothetical protein
VLRQVTRRRERGPAGLATAGTMPSRRASFRRSSSTFCTDTAGRLEPRRGARSSSTSRVSTTVSAAIQRSAISVRQTTNPSTPLCARPNKRVRQTGAGPDPPKSLGARVAPMDISVRRDTEPRFSSTLPSLTAHGTGCAPRDSPRSVPALD